MIRAPRLPEGFALVHRPVVDSTNDEAIALAQSGAPDGTLVFADEQSKGRGRRGNPWQSPPGNLFASLVQRPGVAAATAAQLSFVTALALGAGLADVTGFGARIRYKWPNDVLLDGRKVSGILLESSGSAGGRLEWLVIGVGVNIVAHPESPPGLATSLRAAGSTADAVDVLEAMVQRFAQYRADWSRHGFQPIRERWLASAAGLGETIRVNLPRESFMGRFVDLDDAGVLVVETEGALRHVSAGDVHLGTA